MSKIKNNPSKTINPLHFEDLEPHRFEDLVRQLIYDFKNWQSIEATAEPEVTRVLTFAVGKESHKSLTKMKKKLKLLALTRWKVIFGWSNVRESRSWDQPKY